MIELSIWSITCVKIDQTELYHEILAERDLYVAIQRGLPRLNDVYHVVEWGVPRFHLVERGERARGVVNALVWHFHYPQNITILHKYN